MTHEHYTQAHDTGNEVTSKLPESNQTSEEYQPTPFELDFIGHQEELLEHFGPDSILVFSEGVICDELPHRNLIALGFPSEKSNEISFFPIFAPDDRVSAANINAVDPVILRTGDSNSSFKKTFGNQAKNYPPLAVEKSVKFNPTPDQLATALSKHGEFSTPDYSDPESEMADAEKSWMDQIEKRASERSKNHERMNQRTQRLQELRMGNHTDPKTNQEPDASITTSPDQTT